MNSYEFDSCQIDLSLGKFNFSPHIRVNVFDVLIYGHFPSVQSHVLPALALLWLMPERGESERKRGTRARENEHEN